MLTNFKSTVAPPRRIFVVDDHPLIREGLSAHLANQPNLELCGEAEDIPGAMSRVFDADPDLVIVDISLKNGSGIDLIKRLRAKDPSLVILVWSMHPETLYAERALRAGARGYVSKSKSASQILEAVVTVLDGRTFLSQEMSARLLGRVVGGGQKDIPTSGIEALTDRELETFELLGHGLTTQQIASKMHVSRKTVETYRARIKEKLGLTNATELIQHSVQWVMAQSQQ